MTQAILELVEQSSLKTEVPEFAIGDTVDVHTRILEGEKERIQIFNGVVIARSGAGSREMFTVRRIVQGEGVERKFPLHSPKIARIEVKRSGVVRRAKLYFLRDRIGKAVRLRSAAVRNRQPCWCRAKSKCRSAPVRNKTRRWREIRISKFETSSKQKTRTAESFEVFLFRAVNVF